MGYYVSDSDVVGALNAIVSGTDYKIYEDLVISQNSFSAHVSFADDYLRATVGDLGVDTNRYRLARLAAINLACMRILTVASGGLLVGSVDYSLGDLVEKRGEAVAVAVSEAVAAYKSQFETFIAQLFPAGEKIEGYPSED